MRNRWKAKKEMVPPAWLVNVMIKERVWRWRLNERLNRWLRRELPRRLRFYLMVFLVVGFLGCFLALREALHGRYGLNTKLDSIYRRDTHELRIGFRDRTQMVPRLRADAALFWRLADSIDADSIMRGKLDSVFRSRPGLADSVGRLKDELPRVSK